MGQTCMCCKGNKVAYVLRKMEAARAHELTQEDGCELLYKLCSPGINDVERCNDFAKFDGVRIVADLIKNFRRKELIERAAIRLLRLTAANVKCAEAMRRYNVRSKVRQLVDEEFDDDYIQEDGKQFEEHYYEALKTGGLDQLDDAELADDIAAIIRIMKEKDEIREVQTQGMKLLHARFTNAIARQEIVDNGGIGALIAVLQNHRESPPLVRMTCDVMYHLSKHDANAKSEFGKQNAIHWLAIIYRSLVEQQEADMLQLLLYTMMVLVHENPRNAHRWGQRRGMQLLQQTDANIHNRLCVQPSNLALGSVFTRRSASYKREVHIPFVLRKITEALPEPTMSAEDAGLNVGEKLSIDESKLASHEKVLKEMQMVGKRKLAEPRTRLEKEKMRLLLQVRAESARKLEIERKRAVREERRKQIALARAREEQEKIRKAEEQAMKVIRVRALGEG